MIPIDSIKKTERRPRYALNQEKKLPNISISIEKSKKEAFEDVCANYYNMRMAPIFQKFVYAFILDNKDLMILIDNILEKERAKHVKKI